MRKKGDLGGKEVLLVATLSVALAVTMTWPVARGLTSHVARNVHAGDAIWDPVIQAWEVAWGGHALTNQPNRYFDSNTFWPHRRTLAYGDALIGYAPAGLVGSGTKAALARYNVLLLFSYALAFLGMYLLARELGLAGAASAIAGAAFAYPPWKLAQVMHLHVLSNGGIPLAVFLLLGGWRRRSPRLIVAGWLVAIWQLSLGFTLGLPFAYALAVLAAVVVLVWLARGRPAIGRSVIGAAVGGFALFIAWGALQAQPYLDVQRTYPEQANRPVELVRHFSPPLKGFMTAPDESLGWSKLTARARADLRTPVEQALFPGLTVLWLAGTALGVSSRLSLALRIGLALAIVLSVLLALGFDTAEGRLGYRYVYEYLPGWKGSRTPGRLITFTTLALAVLAGAGAQELIDRRPAPAGDARRVRPRFRAAVGGGLLVLVLVEGLGTWPTTEVPPGPVAQRQAEEPLLFLPSDQLRDGLYMFWSTDGFPRIVNGHNSVVAESLVELRNAVIAFPDASSVEYLLRRGIKTVLVQRDLAAGTPYEDVGTRAVEGLPLQREVVGATILFHLTVPAHPKP